MILMRWKRKNRLYGVNGRLAFLLGMERLSFFILSDTNINEEMRLDIKDGALSFVAQDNVMIGAKLESLCLLSSSRWGGHCFLSFPSQLLELPTFNWTMRGISLRAHP